MAFDEAVRLLRKQGGKLHINGSEAVLKTADGKVFQLTKEKESGMQEKK